MRNKSSSLSSPFILALGRRRVSRVGKPRAGGAALHRPRSLTFVMVPKGVHPYFEPVYRGFEDAAKKYGIVAEVDAPPRFDVALQVKVIEDLIARGVSGIAISANDDKGLVAVIHEAVQAGIKVITVDAPAPSSEALTYIGTDNESAGYEAGKRMAAAMGGQGSVAVLQGGMAATNLNLRTQGFTRALSEKAPGITVVAVVDEGGDFADVGEQDRGDPRPLPRAQRDLQRLRRGGARRGRRAEAAGAGRGRVLVAGFDDLGDTLQGIRDGSIVFCVVQNTYQHGLALRGAAHGRGERPCRARVSSTPGWCSWTAGTSTPTSEAWKRTTTVNCSE